MRRGWGRRPGRLETSLIEQMHGVVATGACRGGLASIAAPFGDFCNRHQAQGRRADPAEWASGPPLSFLRGNRGSYSPCTSDIDDSQMASVGGQNPQTRSMSSSRPSHRESSGSFGIVAHCHSGACQGGVGGFLTCTARLVTQDDGKQVLGRCTAFQSRYDFLSKVFGGHGVTIIHLDCGSASCSDHLRKTTLNDPNADRIECRRRMTRMPMNDPNADRMPTSR
jgi:hypothetical protein